MTDLWTETLRSLQPKLGAETYELWLRPLTLRRHEPGQLFLTAPSTFMKEWFENHYRALAVDALHDSHHGKHSILTAKRAA